MLSVIQQEFYRDYMRARIEDYTKNRPNCANERNERTIRADAVLIDSAKKPFDILNIDKINFDKNDFLLIIDSLARYSWVSQIPNERMTNLLLQFFLSHSTLNKVITDKGTCFQSKNLKTMYEQLGIQQIQISSYHLESNGIAKRIIGTLKDTAVNFEGKPLQKVLKAIKS